MALCLPTLNTKTLIKKHITLSLTLNLDYGTLPSNPKTLI